MNHSTLQKGIVCVICKSWTRTARRSFFLSLAGSGRPGASARVMRQTCQVGRPSATNEDLHGNARTNEGDAHRWVRVLFPPKMGTIPPQIMYFLCIVTCFDVSAMYLKCISSVVFGAFGRLVSLCIVYVSSVHSHVSFLCLVPSFMLLY